MRVSGNAPVGGCAIAPWRSSLFRIAQCLFGVLLSAAIVFSCWAGESNSWRLIGLSAEAGLVVFTDSDGHPATFRSGDFIADRLWRIESVSADHVMLEPIGDGRVSIAVGALLREGDTVPDLARVEQKANFYYEVHGVVVDDLEIGSQYGEAEAEGEK